MSSYCSCCILEYPKYADFLLHMLLLQTQAQETSHLTPEDAVMFAQLMGRHEELDGQAINITLAFTPGSISLTAHALTPKGFEHLRQADPVNINGYNPSTMTETAAVLLSDRVVGSTFAPTGDGIWNMS